MKAWKAIKESVGFAGALIGILWWLGVTPEMVGEQVYAVSYAVLPFVMLASGVLIGWNVKKWQLSKAIDESENQIEAKDKEIAELQNQVADLEKRPTQEQLDERLAEKGASIVESGREPTPQPDPNPFNLSNLALGVYEKMGEDDLAAFKRLCSASVFNSKGRPTRPLVFKMADAALARINLDVASLELLEEEGAIKIFDDDNRRIVGTNALRGKIVDIEDGVKANPGGIILTLADGVRGFSPRLLNWGTDVFAAQGLFGVDFGVVEFTVAGQEIAGTFEGLRESAGLNDYIKDSYSEGVVTSRHRFSCLTEDGEMRRP